MTVFTIYIFRMVISLFKVNYRRTGTRCELCSKLTLKTPGQHSDAVLVSLQFNFEHISHLYSSVLKVNFEHVIAVKVTLFLCNCNFIILSKHVIILIILKRGIFWKILEIFQVSFITFSSSEKAGHFCLNNLLNLIIKS